MSDFRILSDSVLASPQIAAGDLSAAKGEGITCIVNNRPDGESEDQPGSNEIAQAAEALGLRYVHIPITHAGFSMAQVDAMVEALDAAEGKVLAFCRSGTRSTLLWALAQAKRGESPDMISEAAARAGYDIGPVRSAIDALAAERA